MTLALPLAALLAGGGLPPERGPRVDAALVDSRDAPIRLSRFRGKPLVLFYEDRTAADQNARLKRELRDRAAARNLTRAAHVLGVANVGSYDFWPARGLVLSAIRDIERRDRVQILVDWKRALVDAPWRLPDEASSIVLLDADGHWVHSWSGPVSDESMEEFFEMLTRLVEGGPASASL
jgi:hypothetical protein